MKKCTTHWCADGGVEEAGEAVSQVAVDQAAGQQAAEQALQVDQVGQSGGGQAEAEALALQWVDEVGLDLGHQGLRQGWEQAGGGLGQLGQLRGYRDVQKHLHGGG